MTRFIGCLDSLGSISQECVLLNICLCLLTPFATKAAHLLTSAGWESVHPKSPPQALPSVTTNPFSVTSSRSYPKSKQKTSGPDRLNQATLPVREGQWGAWREGWRGEFAVYSWHGAGFRKEADRSRTTDKSLCSLWQEFCVYI